MTLIIAVAGAPERCAVPSRDALHIGIGADAWIGRTCPMAVMAEFFSICAHWTARQAGRASTFALACVIVVVWAATGPVFHYSDTWQLVINTGTTIVTFLMVFLLQHAQNRYSTAIQLKLDELIRVNRDARNKLLTLEDMTELELEQLKQAFASIAGRTGTAEDLQDVRADLEQARQGIAQVQATIEDVASEGGTQPNDGRAA